MTKRTSCAKPDEETELPVAERLLVGLGAAVGAGCLPCSRHYLSKAAEAGVEPERMSAAIAVAAVIRRQAVDEMERRVRQKMGEEVEEPEPPAAELERGLGSLVGLGAAYAANSPPLLRRSIEALRARGLSQHQLSTAAEAARKPKQMAATIAERELVALIGSADPGREEKGCCSSP